MATRLTLNGYRIFNGWTLTAFVILFLVPAYADTEPVAQNSVDEFSRFEIIKPNLQHSQNGSFIFDTRLEYKRSTDEIIRGPRSANKHSLYVELVLVVDNAIHESFGKNLEKVHGYCKDIVNIVYSIFVPLNIFIVLVGVIVWNEGDKIDISRNATETLDNFLDYRLHNLSIQHPNDVAYLLTKQQFDDDIFGQAYVSSICSYTRSGGVVSNFASNIAQTVAHELMHNFGMPHDTPYCICREYLNDLQGGMSHCLRNKPTQLFDSPKCGNGFVERGEQCDCGPGFCRDRCCDAKTCMLHQNALCASGECCDLMTCKPHPKGTVCRQSEGDCDIPEHCTGNSEYCPANNFKRDTELCGGGKAYCYEGACQSHDDQCKLLWGKNGASVNQCYSLNVEGSSQGHCGYDWVNGAFQECSEEDIMCGVLQCKFSENDTLTMGHDEISYTFYETVNVMDGENITCQQAIVGLQIADPGLTPNGAICGDGKMCVQQKCLSIQSLRVNGTGVDCPGNCSGHGVCDNKGHCHCMNGYELPLCKPSSRGRGRGDHCSCNGNGICDKEGRCHCLPGYEPPSCRLFSVVRSSNYAKRFISSMYLVLIGVKVSMFLHFLMACH